MYFCVCQTLLDFPILKHMQPPCLLQIIISFYMLLASENLSLELELDRNVQSKKWVAIFMI